MKNTQEQYKTNLNIRQLIMCLVVLSALSMLGCSYSPSTIVLSNQNKIENEYVVFNAPMQGWYTFGLEWGVKNYGIHPEHQQGQSIYSQVHAYHQIHIRVDSNTQSGELGSIDWEDKLEKMRTQPDPQSVYNDRRWGNYFREYRLVYVAGLQCREYFEIEGAGGLARPHDMHWYYVACDYYQKDRRFENGKRSISFRYYYSPYNNTEKKVADAFLFQSLKEIIDSMVIKNIDVERMNALGLMHYDKTFAIPNYKIYVQEQRVKGYLTEAQKAEMVQIKPLMEKYPFEDLSHAIKNHGTLVSGFYTQREKFDKTGYLISDYEKDAYGVILTGTFMPEKNSFVRLINKENGGMYAVVELNKENQKITAFYVVSKTLFEERKNKEDLSIK